MSAHVAVKESGPGSFGYPWGTERPTAFMKRLDQAIHSSCEDEIRRIREEADRKIRQVEIRCSVLTQIRDSVANCCVLTSSGKLRFKRGLAAAAGPLIDVEALRGVVDLDRRRPGRPSVNKNSETLALRSILRELVYDPAAEERERRGAEARQAERAKSTRSAQSDAVPTTVRAAPAPEPEIVSAAEVVSHVPDAASALAAANEDMVGADAGFAVEPEHADSVAEPVDEAGSIAAPALLPALLDEVGSVFQDLDGADPRVVDLTSCIDKVVDIFSSEIEAQRLSARDPKRLPEGFDPTWAEHWQPDPNAHLPEMYAEFITFGAAINKAPEELTDEEARLLLGPVLFGLPYDYHKNPAKYEGVKLPPVFTREKDVSEFRWQGEIARAGGTLQQIAIKYKDNVDYRREVERARHRMWPLAVRRRDFIKALMVSVAAGELTFAPVSSRMSDLRRSVQWRVFREADHNWLLTISLPDQKLYTQQILDKLPWPAGLSRIELMERFGEGAAPTTLENLSSYGRPPNWLIPDHMWVSGAQYKALAVRREACDLGHRRAQRGDELNVVAADLPDREIRRRIPLAGEGSAVADRALQELVLPLRDVSRWNRALFLPRDTNTGYLSFGHPARVVLESLSGIECVPFSDPRLVVREDWLGEERSALPTDQVEARLRRLEGLITDATDENGVSPLYLALGLAVWDHGDPAVKGAVVAPLMFCPVVLEGMPDTRTLRRVGVPFVNPLLADRLGIDVSALSSDPLDWRAEDLAGYGVSKIASFAVLGLFDIARYRLWRRLDVRQDPDLIRHPHVLRLLAGDVDPWPQATMREPRTPTMMSKAMDRAQAEGIDLSRCGANFAIQGGPGTGKTHVIAHILGNAAKDGRTVLLLSGRASAFRAVLSRLAGTGVESACLSVFGAECEPQRVADRLGVEPGQRVVETLDRLTSMPAIVMATPRSYAMHVPADWAFDLLVVDEASLVPLAEGLPALAACDQVVICGDSQQMQKDVPLYEMFSLERPWVPQPTLLDAAVDASLPVLTLMHHYRSRHPALMHIANWISYDAVMRISPTPFPDRPSPFSCRQVAGSFDWETLTNAVEAEAIVDEIARHIASGSTASVGVIAMTMQQRDLIRRRIAEREFDLSTITGGESLLVADFNSIQGEERDVILVGMTFGPRPGETAWPTSYGALSLPGGEKRLNVIMTRSRERMLLLTSFPKESIDAARAIAHSNLFSFMLNAERAYRDDPLPHDGVLAEVFHENAWQALSLGSVVGAFDRDTRRFLMAIYVTGDLDDLTERSEMAQLRNSGWRIEAMSRDELAALADDWAGRLELARRLRWQYRVLSAA
ncbi:DUF4011 domain-containing protein [Methylobacterium brachiatum]|nr:DUF4011 domain-containing protein [Methylobacterium brachiatum]